MSNKFLKSIFLAVLCAAAAAFAQVAVVANNVGYERTGVKRAIVQSAAAITATEAQVVNAGGTVVLTITLGPQHTVDQWSGPNFRYFKVADFSDLTANGDGYRVRVGTAESFPFSIGEKVLQTKTGADQVGFFNGMRNTDAGDRNLPIFGSDQTHNIYGGWWDATGDPGKHLSHLAYSNYLTPQQIPMVVWALLHANEVQPGAFGVSARAEAAWGADYLLRSIAPEGFFYMSVFDNWGDGYTWTTQPSGTRAPREICVWGTMDGRTESTMDNTWNGDGIRGADYQSAMREGAGVSIAALARSAKAGISGDSSAAQYLAGAKRAYAHLKANPTKYQDNGRQNIIDYYCGLLAASELFNATNDEEYRNEAREWAAKLLDLQTDDGWFYSERNTDANRHRPFYHAAEEGFPVVALSRYYYTAAPSSEKAGLRDAIRKNLLWYNRITYEASNPFEYAKMYRAVPTDDGGGDPATLDLALGKPATASRSEGAYTPDKAFTVATTNDSRWSSFQNGAENDMQWIAVDLGAVYKVDKVVLNWEAAYGEHYRIEVSLNGSNWTQAFEITNHDRGGIVTHTFTAVDARHVRMFGIKRGFEHGGFSLFRFEVYGQPDGPDVPPSPYQARFFIPKVNETGYWWQGENARLASMASAFILGAPLAEQVDGSLWPDTLFTLATAQLDWILGRNPFDLSMMYGVKGEDYPNFPATRALDNIKGGICNGISSARNNENNIEWMPYEYGENFWRNWRFIEQWLPHNAWYLVAISSLSYRIDNPIVPEVSVKHHASAKHTRLGIKVANGRNVRIELPFAADQRTEIVIYNMQGRKVFAHAIEPGARTAQVKISSRIARGMYVLSVRDMAGKNVASSKIHLR
jgi:hypothetical protein